MDFKKNKIKLPRQVVGNVGLYYISYKLSKLGWNVLPTSRNTRGVDLIIYNQSAKIKYTIQIKTLSKRNPVPLGSNLKNLIAEYIIICRNIFSEELETFIATVDDIREKINEKEKNGKKSYWIQPKDYEEFQDKWEKIGLGVK